MTTAWHAAILLGCLTLAALAGGCVTSVNHQYRRMLTTTLKPEQQRLASSRFGSDAPAAPDATFAAHTSASVGGEW